MFREKIKNETVATFYDVCGVFGSKNDQFFTFAFGLKVINLFKAKMEAFRERKSSKVENGQFWLHLTPNFLGRDETRFFTFSIPKPCANSDFNLSFALRDFLTLGKLHHVAFYYSDARFLIILEPFWALSQRSARRTDRPSRPRPSRRKFSSRVRAPPPRSNIGNT